MNWLDYSLILILVIGAVVGLRIGILGAVYSTIVVFLGWLIAAQLGTLVGRLFELFLDDDRVITVVSFTVIMGVVVYFGGKLWTPLRTALGVSTLGASNIVDYLGGMLVGLVLGVALSGALLVGLMRLTHTSNATIEVFQQELDSALVESTLVPAFVNGTYALPADSLGLIPGDFQSSLEYYRDRIE